MHVMLDFFDYLTVDVLNRKTQEFVTLATAFTLMVLHSDSFSINYFKKKSESTFFPSVLNIYNPGRNYGFNCSSKFLLEITDGEIINHQI